MSKRESELRQLKAWLEFFVMENPSDWQYRLGSALQGSHVEQLSQFGTSLMVSDLQHFNRKSQESFESTMYEARGGAEGFAKEFCDRQMPKPSYR